MSVFTYHLAFDRMTRRRKNWIFSHLCNISSSHPLKRDTREQITMAKISGLLILAVLLVLLAVTHGKICWKSCTGQFLFPDFCPILKCFDLL